MTQRFKNVGACPDFSIRSDWPTARFWQIAKLRKESKRPDLGLLSVFLGRGVIPYDSGGGQVHKPGHDLSAYQVVHPGDLVLNNQQAWRGSVGVSRYLGIISPAYVVTQISESLEPAFADYLFQSPFLIDQYLTSSKGVGDIQRDIHMSRLKNVVVPLPPLSDQLAIVKFLDHKKPQIDSAIRAKKRLIALLNEKKQFIICDAISHGIDKSVQLKSSVIPWVDRIPKHWDQLPIKRILARMDYGTSEASADFGSIRILTMGNIQKGEVILPDKGGLDQISDSLILHHHDLLFTRTNGNPDLVGKVGIFRGENSDKVSFASYLVRLRVKPAYDPEWLHLLLNSSAFWPFARSHALVNLQTNLNSTRYGQFVIPVPPAAEQAKIVKWVGTESKPLTAAVSRLEREIELIREYRARLTADLVTGKLDVRNAAPALANQSLIQSPPADGANESDEPGAAEDEPAGIT